MIIKSLIDTDLYTLSVGYFFKTKFPEVESTYRFKDRNNTIYPKGFDKLLKDEINNLSLLSLTDGEFGYLVNKISYIPKHYFEWLKTFRFDPNNVIIEQDYEGHLSIEIKGRLYEAIYYEVPILAIVSELYHDSIGDVPDIDYIYENTKIKALLLKENNIMFSDFGTRRRFSYDIHDYVVLLLKQFASNNLIGTSNIFLGYKHNLKPIGTMSHQFIMTIGALYGYRQANSVAMDMWQEVFGSELSTFLYDTYTSKPFEENIIKQQLESWGGFRVDSGDNFKAIDDKANMCLKHGVKPETKRMVFSNGLTAEDCVEIHNYNKGVFQDSYGIGTSMVCDCGNNIKPSNIVIKLSTIRKDENSPWIDCVKLSDDLGKYTGEKEAVDKCLSELALK